MLSARSPCHRASLCVLLFCQLTLSPFCPHLLPPQSLITRASGRRCRSGLRRREHRNVHRRGRESAFFLFRSVFQSATFLDLDLKEKLQKKKPEKKPQQGWYNTLKKSKLTPPDSAFGPVWTVLYIMMGISSVQAFRAGARGVPLVLYGAQLAVRFSFLFFLFFLLPSLCFALPCFLSFVSFLSLVAVKEGLARGESRTKDREERKAEQRTPSRKKDGREENFERGPGFKKKKNSF